MAISYISVSNAVAQSAGTTTTPGTASVTPTAPASMATTDRIIIVQAHSAVAGATPSPWVAIFKDQVIGSGAVAAGGGLRYLSAYHHTWRSNAFSMPALPLTSATQNSNAVAAVALRKAATETWDPPTFSVNAEYFGTAGTAYSATTGSAFTTTTGGMIVAGTALNDLVTMASPTISGGGGGLGAITERSDGGTATGNDVALQVHTIPVTTGGSGTITHAGTLSAASQGGTVFIQQTVSTTTAPTSLTDNFSTSDTSKWRFAGTASVTGGQLSLPAIANSGSAAQSLIAYDLRGSEVIIEMPTKQPGTGSSGCGLYVQTATWPYSADAMFGHIIDGTNHIFRHHINNVAPSDTSATYSATNDRWMRLRASADAANGAGTIYWDTAPDSGSGSPGTWTNRRSMTPGFAPSSVYVVAYSENWGGDGGAGTALFDNYNPIAAAASVLQVVNEQLSVSVRRSGFY